MIGLAHALWLALAPQEAGGEPVATSNALSGNPP